MINKPVLAITVGDPNGIGAEVILKAFSDPAIRALCRPLLVGPLAVFHFYNQMLQQPLSLLSLVDTDFIPDDDTVLPVWEPVNFETTIEPGKITKNAGHIAGLCIEEAGIIAMQGKVDGMVTAPASKEALLLDGYPAPGHTDLLANVCGVEDVVSMMVWQKLRVALYTMHRPLRNVAESIERDRVVQKLRVVDKALGTWFGIAEPRIGICGLNPHASDGGLFGKEDLAALVPSVEKALREGLIVIGPKSAESLFLNWEQYDCIFSLYHDQGVTPTMLLSGGKACYVTLGLPFIRVAPGHGTAFDIAGKNSADGSRMADAIQLAVTAINQRHSSSGERSANDLN